MTERAKALILIVDDDRDMCASLADYLEDYGYLTELANDGPTAVEKFQNTVFDAVIADLRMPGMDGFGLLETVRQLDSTMPFFIMTAFGSIENALEAVKRGAYHYFSKPLKSEEVLLYLERALEHRSLEKSRGQLLRDIQDRYTFESMVGRSPQMRQIFDLIDRVANSTASVLISGESGTGKELIARGIHYRGQRAKSSFVPLNCSAIPAQLLESELFGYTKGAFTGAAKPRAGLALEANGGTLFLDEIGDMPIELQPKVLRFLQEGEVRPVGSDVVRKVDVRVVAATNNDLNAMVRSGAFRKDLYYRLNVVPIAVPPLKERKEDIPLLVARLLEKICPSGGNHKNLKVSPRAMELLVRNDWPGNVRELENALERAATLTSSEVIDVVDLGFVEPPAGTSVLREVAADWPTLRQLEERYIDLVMEHVEGNRVKAAAITGVDPSTLYRRKKRSQKPQ